MNVKQMEFTRAKKIWELFKAYMAKWTLIHIITMWSNQLS